LIFPEVVTLQQLNRLLDPYGPTGGKLSRAGTKPKNIAFIHCVGARQVKGVNQAQPDGRVKDYCGRTCCTAALHAAEEIKKLHPEVQIASFYQDIRTYGRGHEEYYERASKDGVLFFRYDPYHPPEVLKDPRHESPLIVKARDKLSNNIEIEYPADLVVLATGVVPHDISELVEQFRCAVGYDSFLLEVHPKLRPVELAVSGVFLAGSCQGPMDITECTAAAAAAAAKAATLIAQGEVEMDPFIAVVEEELCAGCQTCLTVCPYDAISFDAQHNVAVIGEALCTGCGTCVATCPSDAIQQLGFNDNEVLSEVLALLGAEAGEPVATT
jgi:heterodisulfide reductase subunit A